jgi:hypothetical protein
MVTVVVRALIHGGGVESTLKLACLCLFLFAAIGWIVGQWAEQIVVEAARSRLMAQLAAASSTGRETDEEDTAG